MPGVSGKYRLDQRLGGGGMAEVFLASAIGAEGFSRKVAIKRVLPGFSDNEAFAQMFVDEAQISSQLVHPNIVSVLDFDRDDEQRLFLVMELVEGKDLDALLATGLLPIPLVIYVIAEILRGLGYAHDLPVGAHVRGVVHRDVSPHNVLLSWEGAVKVSDFGIAKARAASEATASIFIKGKPAYMSPEQANGQPLDGRSDLFAAGIMLWEMLVGRRLFVGDDTRATLAAVLFGQIPRPRSLRGDVAKDLERVTMKLLERDLPARHATAEEAIAELLECTDAPKAGRELLTATLGERFADQAPVRHSQRRIRPLPQASRAPSGPSGTLPDGSPASPAAPTPAPAAPAPVGAVALPSLGSVRNAPTGTLDHGDSERRRRKLVLAGAVLVLAALGSFAVVSAVSGRTATGDGSGGKIVAQVSGGDPAPTPAIAPRAAAVDAAVSPPPPPPPLSAPADAAAPSAPEPADAGIVRGAPPARPAGPVKTGTLNVPGYPSLAVYWHGRKIGESPCRLPLPVGTHSITLMKQGSDVKYTDKTISVTIKEDETTDVQR
jgi:serine/threonine-protein kinase